MKKIINSIKAYSQREPMSFVLILAIIVRLIAVFFAKGFGMHDDHFLYIEVPQSWVDGYDYNRWLPWTPGNQGPQGHSLFYPGINYLLLNFLKSIGIVSPAFKMLLIRLVHALFSLLMVSVGYKITRKLSDQKSALMVGIILAIGWAFPWLSVRSMVEIVAIPLLMLSVWSLVKNDFEQANLSAFSFVMSGIWSGLAFSVRFQVAFFILGLGLVILFKKGFLNALFYSIGFAIVVILTQGLVDVLVWKRPFAEFMEYVNYNMVHKGDYPNGPWYNYFLVIMGVVIPPISLFMIAGVAKTWRRLLVVFIPMFLFFAFHSYFPNKQERFILPILPFFIILGVIGWNELRSNQKVKWLSNKAERGVWIFAFSLNLVLLVGISTMYSKKSRVESMIYISRYKEVNTFLIENSIDNVTLYSPIFYAGQRLTEYISTQEAPIDSTRIPWIASTEPRFVLFYTQKDLDLRVDRLRKILPLLQYETTIYPSYIDQLMSTINPVNKNYIVTIYRNRKFQLSEK